jgi:hypothetical protein
MHVQWTRARLAASSSSPIPSSSVLTKLPAQNTSSNNDNNISHEIHLQSIMAMSERNRIRCASLGDAYEDLCLPPTCFRAIDRSCNCNAWRPTLHASSSYPFLQLQRMAIGRVSHTSVTTRGGRPEAGPIRRPADQVPLALGLVACWLARVPHTVQCST